MSGGGYDEPAGAVTRAAAARGFRSAPDRGLAALRVASGTVAAGLLALAVAVAVAAALAGDRPGPGAGTVAGHVAVAVAALTLQAVADRLADRRRGALAALPALVIFALAAAALWLWWWN